MVLPTRKIIPVFIACLIIIGGIFAWLEYKNQGKIISNEGVISVADQKIIDSIATKDTDGDGLKDWEEALWRTAPNNPDTDADGAKDGEEVAQNRDPAKAGPDDQLTLDSASTTPSAAKPLTVSNQFSRDLFTRYVTIKQTGNGDPADFENYSDLVISYIEQEAAALALKTYGAGSFKVIENETPADIHRYGNEFGALFVADEIPDMENELAVLNRATETDNPLELKKLDANIAAYEEIRAGLLKISVPSRFLPDHLTLTNAVETILLGIESMKLTFADPIKAAAGLKNYPDAAGSIFSLLQSIGGGLEESGATFAQTEMGFRFINLVK